MSANDRNRETFHRAFVLLLFVAVSAIFLGMIRGLILAVLIGAIFTALTYPLYTRLLRFFHGRTSVAAAASLVLVLAGYCDASGSLDRNRSVGSLEYQSIGGALGQRALG